MWEWERGGVKKSEIKRDDDTGVWSIACQRPTHYSAQVRSTLWIVHWQSWGRRAESARGRCLGARDLHCSLLSALLRRSTLRFPFALLCQENANFSSLGLFLSIHLNLYFPPFYGVLQSFYKFPRLQLTYKKKTLYSRIEIYSRPSLIFSFS